MINDDYEFSLRLRLALNALDLFFQGPPQSAKVAAEYRKFKQWNLNGAVLWLPYAHKKHVVTPGELLNMKFAAFRLDEAVEKQLARERHKNVKIALTIMRQKIQELIDLLKQKIVIPA